MILTDLQREWDTTLADAPSPWPALPGTLDDVLATIRLAPDDTLGLLLAALAQGDELAGRVVVQTMLPKLRRLAAAGTDADALVAHLWLVAAEYPLERRPARIAANLVLDARKRAWGELARPDVVALPEDVAAPTPHVEAGARQVVGRAVALRLVTPATAALLVEVYDDGRPGREVALRHRLSEPAVRQRCSKAVRRMSAHRLALVA